MGDKVARGSSQPNSPGLFGALKDAIGAISKSVAPKSITERRGTIDTAVDEAAGADLDAMRRRQHSDHNN